jgi:2-keto-4-pentenoate hydratase/2-oxohepta-3-ene-1,7-dioic acid hydratase in catechol pathway
MAKHVKIKGTNEIVIVNNIFCIGKNYLEHIKEMGGTTKMDTPVVFMKPNTAIAENGIISIPEYNNKKIGSELHYETEVIAVIGKDGKDVAIDEAHDYILGYTIGIDFTLRDLQSRAKEKGLPWLTAKGFSTSAPVSDIIPKEKISKPGNFRFSLEINGQLKQKGNTSDMLFGFKEIVSYISAVFGISKGDLIFTGTPDGVGRMYPGDKLIARLNNELELKAEYYG